MAGAVTLAFILFIASVWWTFYPPTEEPDEVDVLLLLGPHEARLYDAENFMEEGRAEALVIATFSGSSQSRV